MGIGLCMYCVYITGMDFGVFQCWLGTDMTAARCEQLWHDS